jgi:uncharacterized Zn finger protein
MDSKCPSCGSTDWLSVGHGERRYAKCLQCGQIMLLQLPTVASSPIPSAKVGAFLLGLFPAADRQQNP